MKVYHRQVIYNPSNPLSGEKNHITFLFTFKSDFWKDLNYLKYNQTLFGAYFKLNNKIIINVKMFSNEQATRII